MTESKPCQQQDDVGVLLKVIQLVAGLASMEAHAYEASLWHRPSSKDPQPHSPTLPNTSNDEASTSCESCCHIERSVFPASILPAIAALQREYDFDSHTAVPVLVRAVHRLQSNRLCLHRELELRESHVESLQRQLLQVQQQRDCLQGENSDLRSQLSKARSDKRTLKEAVRTYQAANGSQRNKVKLLQEVNRILQVRVHEQQLQAKRPRSVGDDEPAMAMPAPSPLTARSDSELLKGKERRCDEDGTEATDASTATPMSPTRNFAGYEYDDTSPLPTFIHTITDYGTATVRFPSSDDAYDASESCNDSSLSSLDENSTISALSPCTSPIPWSSQSPVVGHAHCQPSASYTLTYSMGSKMGLRVRPVELESEKESKASAQLLQPPRRPLIPTESLMVPNPTLHTSTDATSTEDQSFSNHLGSLLGKKPAATAATTSRPRQAFLVCGYTDAESSSSSSSSLSLRPVKKPPIGARIVAVNGQPVGSSWTFAEFLDRMKQADGSRTTASPATSGLPTGEESLSYYTVTFRNDRLTERQREQLAPPIRVDPTRSSPAPGLFVRDNPVASSAFKAVSHVGAVADSSLVTMPSEPNPSPPPGTESKSSMLSSISSSFWSKAAEMYAS